MQDLAIKKMLRMRIFTFLAVMGLTLLTQGIVLEAAHAETSQIMPLAEKALLLDGQVVGDRIIVVGERGHILTSEDNGQTWQQQDVPTRATLTSVFFIDPARGWAAGHDSVILHTSDGGRHWEEIYSDPEDERPILDLWFRNANYGYAVGAYGLFLMTQDGGKSWEPADFSPATFLAHDAENCDPWEEDEDEVLIDFHLNQISATTSGRIFIAAEAGNFYRSDDGCRSWLSLPSPYEGSFYGSLPLTHKAVLLYGLRGHLFRSDDAGETWSELETNTQATLNDGILLTDGRIVLGGLAGALLISEDNGQSFQLHAQADRAGIARILQTGDDALLLIGEHGVKRLAVPSAEKEK